MGTHTFLSCSIWWERPERRRREISDSIDLRIRDENAVVDDKTEGQFEWELWITGKEAREIKIRKEGHRIIRCVDCR